MNAGLPPVDSRVQAKSLVKAVAKAAYAVLSPSFSSGLNDALADLHSGKTIGLHLQNVPCSFVPPDWTSGDLYFTKQHLIQLAVNYSLIGDHQLELESRFLMGSNRNSVERMKPWFILNQWPIPPHWDRVPFFSLSCLHSRPKSVQTRFFALDAIVKKHRSSLLEMRCTVDEVEYSVFEHDDGCNIYRLNPVVHQRKIRKDIFSLEDIKKITCGIVWEEFCISPTDIIVFRDDFFVHDSVHVTGYNPDVARLLAAVEVRVKAPDLNIAPSLPDTPAALAAYITEQRVAAGL
jgi:hypothetical protein